MLRVNTFLAPLKALGEDYLSTYSYIVQDEVWVMNFSARFWSIHTS